jgi:CAP12/Pycsar effector protein, TIR domain
MDPRLIVHVAAPQEKNLAPRQRRLVQGVLDRIEQAGMRVDLGSFESDRLEERYQNLRRCHGVLVIGVGQWEARRLYRNQDRKILFPSEFTHVACTMAVAAKRPVLVLREKAVAERGTLRRGYIHPVLQMPNGADVEWLACRDFNDEFSKWLKLVKCHKHVFLGYSSQSGNVADRIKTFMVEELHLTVFDWRDFRPGATIWDSIEDGERLTDCGVFLFMADDKLSGAAKRQPAPRDNVVFEAGYFAGAKGREFTTIIRERGAKIPTDLGGVLYLELSDREDISPIRAKLREHLVALQEAQA